jgi:DNA-binding NarL/FixJ family response regulator
MPANASAKIRILIVDDKAHVRQGLQTVLQLSEGFEIVGEACNGLEAIRAAELLKPEVVLMDLEMPVLGGLEATRRIKEQYPEIGVVILTIHGSDDVREQAMRAGSDAFVEKEAPTEDLIAVIQEVRTTSFDDRNGERK